MLSFLCSFVLFCFYLWFWRHCLSVDISKDAGKLFSNSSKIDALLFITFLGDFGLSFFFQFSWLLVHILGLWPSCWSHFIHPPNLPLLPGLRLWFGVEGSLGQDKEHWDTNPLLWVFLISPYCLLITGANILPLSASAPVMPYYDLTLPSCSLSHLLSLFWTWVIVYFCCCNYNVHVTKAFFFSFLHFGTIVQTK